MEQQELEELKKEDEGVQRGIKRGEWESKMLRWLDIFRGRDPGTRYFFPFE